MLVTHLLKDMCGIIVEVTPVCLCDTALVAIEVTKLGSWLH
jgi:hypothetical protein